MNRPSLSLILILSVLSNIFISAFHFAHKGHSIDPITGKTLHTHNCSELEKHCSFNEGFNQESDHHNTTEDQCFVLDALFKHSLQNSAPSSVIKVFKDFSYIPVYSELTTDFEDILSFAPKNSPPAA